MRFELFPSAEHLSPLIRGVYKFCALVGMAMLFLTLFFVTVDIVTSPRLSRLSIGISVIAAVMSAGHVVRETRAIGPLSVWRWVAFVFSATVFGIELWVAIANQTAREVFLCMLVIGAVLLFAARLLNCGRRAS